AAGVVADGQGHPLVLGSAPKLGLAAAGVADDGDGHAAESGSFGEVVDRAARSPGPGGDGAPGVVGAGRRFGILGGARFEHAEDAAFEAVVPVVGGDVVVVKRGGGVAAGDDLVGGPERVGLEV